LALESAATATAFFHVDNEPQQQLQAAPDMYDKELAKNATVF
jgi:hypothetical protein